MQQGVAGAGQRRELSSPDFPFRRHHIVHLEEDFEFFVLAEIKSKK